VTCSMRPSSRSTALWWRRRWRGSIRRRRTGRPAGRRSRHPRRSRSSPATMLDWTSPNPRGMRSRSPRAHSPGPAPRRSGSPTRTGRKGEPLTRPRGAVLAGSGRRRRRRLGFRPGDVRSAVHRPPAPASVGRSWRVAAARRAFARMRLRCNRLCLVAGRRTGSHGRGWHGWLAVRVSLVHCRRAGRHRFARRVDRLRGRSPRGQRHSRASSRHARVRRPTPPPDTDHIGRWITHCRLAAASARRALRARPGRSRPRRTDWSGPPLGANVPRRLPRPHRSTTGSRLPLRRGGHG